MHRIRVCILGDWNRLWVANLAPSFNLIANREFEHFSLSSRHVPRVMDVGVGDFGELRDPDADERSLFVIVFRLFEYVEVVDPSRTDTSYRVPVPIVRVHIVVD